jgi:hypothetical protein
VPALAATAGRLHGRAVHHSSTMQQSLQGGAQQGFAQRTCSLALILGGQNVVQHRLLQGVRLKRCLQPSIFALDDPEANPTRVQQAMG